MLVEGDGDGDGDGDGNKDCRGHDYANGNGDGDGDGDVNHTVSSRMIDKMPLATKYILLFVISPRRKTNSFGGNTSYAKRGTRSFMKRSGIPAAGTEKEWGWVGWR